MLFGPGFSSDNSGDGPENKRKKNYRRDSVGSVKTVRKKLRKEEDFKSPKTDAELLSIIEGQANHCRRKCKCSEKGCFMDAFKIGPGQFDSTKAYACMRENQAKVLNMTKQEKTQEGIRLFWQHTSTDSTNGKWKHDWHFIKETVSGVKQKIKCCIKVFAELHGFSKNTFENISAVLKKQLTAHPEERVPCTQRVVNNLSHKPFLDHHIYCKSYNGVREIFDRVCSETNVPENIIRAALTPSPAKFNSGTIVDRNALAVAWLEHYVDHFADISPNSEFKKVNASFLKEVYEMYLNSEVVKKTGKFVSYNIFLDLWGVIFPYATKRPWCNIPGKCETCYQIDKARRNTTDAKIHVMLQELHTIHRGVTILTNLFYIIYFILFYLFILCLLGII